MAKIEVSIDYLAAVAKFKTHLTDILAKAEDRPNAVSVSVDVTNGRKFDRVRVGYSFSRPNATTGSTELVTEWDVRFFISRTNGAIYGKKSDLAPNLKWFFGDIYTTDEWEWSTTGATPKDTSKYKVASEYGKYKHYERITQDA